MIQDARYMIKKSEIRISKLETNKCKILMLKIQSKVFWSFEFFLFEFVSCFVLRISDLTSLVIQHLVSRILHPISCSLRYL